MAINVNVDLASQLLSILGISLPNPIPSPLLPTLRQRLDAFRQTGATITQVFVDATQIPGEPDLLGVRVIELGLDFVVFSQTGSGAGGTFTIALDSIIGIEV